MIRAITILGVFAYATGCRTPKPMEQGSGPYLQTTLTEDSITKLRNLPFDTVTFHLLGITFYYHEDTILLISRQELSNDNHSLYIDVMGKLYPGQSLIRIESIGFLKNKKYHRLLLRETYASDAYEFTQLPIRVLDFNFDFHEDIAIYSSLSGAHNVTEDIFLYDQKLHTYRFSQVLSDESNLRIDYDIKLLHSHSSFGMMGQLYSAKTFSIEKGKMKMVCSESQTFHDSLDVFIHRRDTLTVSGWLTQIDTLKADEF